MAGKKGRLEASAEKTKAAFSGADQAESEKGQRIKVELKKKPTKPETLKEGPDESDEKKEKVTFSVKIDPDVMKRWRIYTSLEKYGDKGRMTEQALSEFMERHKLTEEQKKKFETLYNL